MQISFHITYLNFLNYGVHTPSPAWNPRISSNGEEPEFTFEQKLYAFIEYTLDEYKKYVKCFFSLIYRIYSQILSWRFCC